MHCILCSRDVSYSLVSVNAAESLGHLQPQISEDVPVFDPCHALPIAPRAVTDALTPRFKREASVVGQSDEQFAQIGS
jgi:hypothetical protein